MTHHTPPSTLHSPPASNFTMALLLSSPPQSLPLPTRLSHHPNTTRLNQLHIPRISLSSSPSVVLFNGYPGGAASFLSANPNPKPYIRKHSCLIFPPPRGQKPLAVVKFLGGAFVGAVPEVTYCHLMELLAREGYLVVSVPYNVTFDHKAAAQDVFERFHACFDVLTAVGVPDVGLGPEDITGLPFYSVGHSNGALLQLLIGSYFSEKIPKANVVVSFNNRPASEAVPYFEQIGPLFRQVMPIMEVSPIYSMASNASGDALKVLLDTAETLIQDQEAVVSLNNFVDQLPSVMNQVTQGISEFKPTPPENRESFKNSYNIPNTLLVKFSTDAIDETQNIEDILTSRVEFIGGRVNKIILSGNHLTPCIQDLTWQVGPQYTPADAVAQSLKSLALNETRTLARTIIDWFISLASE